MYPHPFNATERAELEKRGYAYTEPRMTWTRLHKGKHIIALEYVTGGWLARVNGKALNSIPRGLPEAYDLAERRIDKLEEETVDDEKPILLMALLTLAVLVLTAWYVFYAQ